MGAPPSAMRVFFAHRLRWDSKNLNQPLSTQHKSSVPHPFGFFLVKGWEGINLNSPLVGYAENVPEENIACPHSNTTSLSAIIP
ncbi:MAG: hypothetical protein WBE38_19505, partial [Terracidiphilus sp.]